MIAALVGGQFGSEGKGLIAGHISSYFDVHVRVGAANAGHTVYTFDKEIRSVTGDWPFGEYRDWQKHVVQQLPCAAYANPKAELILGAGALLSPEILQEEILKNQEWRATHGHAPLVLYVDYRAHMVGEHHKKQEDKTDLEATIGSTSATAREGIGAAQAARVLRWGYCTVEEGLDQIRVPKGVICPIDTIDRLHEVVDECRVLLEGTQGTSLSNTTGIYPYVTSRCVSAPGLAADCGVAKLDEVVMVCRCHPIRVAGNSGPFWWDSNELSWDEIGINPEKERTTVTKKVRRVASFSLDQVIYNARINGATAVALTFADYVCAGLAERYGPTTPDAHKSWPQLGVMIEQIEQSTGLPVRWIGTGPHSVIDRELSLKGALV